MTHEARWLDQVYTDTRLSARDKAVYTLMFLRRDATQEYRLGLNAVRQQLGGCLYGDHVAGVADVGIDGRCRGGRGKSGPMDSGAGPP